QPVASRAVNLRPPRVEAITSLRVEESEMKRILTALGFEQRTDDSAMLTLTVPSWRHDVSIEEDLVEEIARHTGYNKIKTSLPPAVLAGEYHLSEVRKRRLRQALAACGFDEAINLSFIEETNDFQLISTLGEQREAVIL